MNGIWWFPDNPEKRWTGRLKLKKGKTPRVRFLVPNNAGFTAPLFPPAIWGQDQHGKPVSVLRLGRHSLTSSFTISRAVYGAGHVFTGLHIKDTDELAITRLSVFAQQLVGWLGRTGFQNRDVETRKDTVSIRFNLPQVIEFDLQNDLKLNFFSSFRSWQRYREQGVREDAYAQFQCSTAISFQQAHDLVASLTKLLHFSTLERVYPIQIRGRHISSDCEAKSRDFEWFSGWLRDYVEPDIDRDRWVFTFSDMQESFAATYGHWLSVLSAQHEALSSYFTTVYNPLPNSVEHLCLTQALEAYHGVKYDTHHKHFELKIRDLAERFKLHLSGLFDDATDFAVTVRHNRNYYTHHNPKWLSDGRVLKDTALYRLNEKLRLLFQACMLEELRIPLERCGRLKRQLATNIVEFY